MPDLIPEERYGLAVTDAQRSEVRVSAVRFEIGKAILRTHDEFPDLTYEEILAALLLAAQRSVGHMRSDHADSHPCGPPSIRGVPVEFGGPGGMVAAVLRWVGDELETAVYRDRKIDIDVIDHIRCVADQRHRGTLVPWPEGLPRPTRLARTLGLEQRND